MAREPRELISIPEAEPVVRYVTGAGGEIAFTFPFPYWSAADVRVFTRAVGESPWVERFDYALTPSGGFPQTGYPSGTVTFSVAQIDTEVMLIRDGTFDRLSNLPPGQAIDIYSLNRDLNRTVGLLQTLKMQSLTLGPGGALSFAPVENRVLGFDAGGEVELRTVSESDARSLALQSEVDGVRALVTIDPTAIIDRLPTIAAMLAVPAPVDGASTEVTQPGRGGTFVFDASLVGAADNGRTFKADDATPGSWVRRDDGPVNALWWGAVGDGVTDDTLALQACFDSVLTGVIRVPALEYLVSKNDALNYLNGDEPCLEIRGASDLVVYCGGATFKVNVHGQGILEILESTDVLVEGLTLVGAGEFPPLDGTSGSGEKGTPSIGWNTTFSGVWGAYKNNRLDTSANTAGGFGGAFPQYAGGTAATWGVWKGGGFIGNVAYGLLIQNGCERVTVDSCKASGFNYSGLAVGHAGDATLAENKDIKFRNCVGVGNQSAGIDTMRVDGVAITNCVLSENGHPDWLPSNTTAQAGYGYTARGIATYYTKNAVVSGCLVEGNDRKGLDAHAVVGLTLTDNLIRNCGINGISVPHTNATQPCRSIVIRGNVIERCSYATNNIGVILGGGPIDGGYSYAGSICDLVIDGNLMIDCGGTGIEIKNGRNIQITNNILRGYDDRASGQKYFMFLGRLSTVEPIYNLNCSGNVCDADGDTDRYRGISVRYARNSQVNHNMVYMDHADVSQGIDLHQCTTTQAFGNVVYHDPANLTSVPIALLQTDGMTIGNLSDPDAGNVSYPIGNETTVGEREKRLRVPHVIQLDITFNGTVSPSYVVNAGEDYIASVQELATYGAGITFKNLEANMSLRSFLTNKSADGLNTGGGFAGHIYERGLSHSGMEIGLKTAANGSNIIASNVNSGTLSVTLMVF